MLRRHWTAAAVGRIRKVALELPGSGGLPHQLGSDSRRDQPDKHCVMHMPVGSRFGDGRPALLCASGSAWIAPAVQWVGPVAVTSNIVYCYYIEETIQSAHSLSLASEACPPVQHANSSNSEPDVPCGELRPRDSIAICRRWVRCVSELQCWIPGVKVDGSFGDPCFMQDDSSCRRRQPAAGPPTRSHRRRTVLTAATSVLFVTGVLFAAGQKTALAAGTLFVNGNPTVGSDSAACTGSALPHYPARHRRRSSWIHNCRLRPEWQLQRYLLSADQYR